VINKKKSFYEGLTFEGNERDRSPLLPYLFKAVFSWSFLGVLFVHLRGAIREDSLKGN